MYLIISTIKTIDFISRKLSDLKIETINIPCVKLEINQTEIERFKSQITTFDYIVISSPFVIDHIKLFKDQLHPQQIFIVTGNASYHKLAAIVPNQIYMPRQNSGVDYLVKDILAHISELNKKRIAILHGDMGLTTIEDYLDQRYDTQIYTTFLVYTQQFIKLDDKYIKKALNLSTMQGIILTSSQHARYILNLLKQERGLLQTLRFFVLHQNIAEVLYQFGLRDNIFISSEASNKSLIDLIRKLHDR